VEPQPLALLLVVDRQSQLGYLDFVSLFRPAVGVAGLGGFLGIPVAVGLAAAFAGLGAASAGIPVAVGLAAAFAGLGAASAGIPVAEVAACAAQVEDSDIQEAVAPVVVGVACIEPASVGLGNFVGGMVGRGFPQPLFAAEVHMGGLAGVGLRKSSG
jgi:hypothetical protein